MPVTETICLEFMFPRRILANKFANHLNDSVWETLAQRRETTHICALLEEHNGEPEWNSIGDTSKETCYLSRDDHDRDIKATEQGTNFGKYTFVNRTI